LEVRVSEEIFRKEERPRRHSGEDEEEYDTGEDLFLAASHARSVAR
jgi:hypothetical protein